MAHYIRSEIRIDGDYPVIELLELSMDLGVNRHGTLTYGGYVSEADAARCLRQSAEAQIVSLFLGDKLEFCGYPQEINLECNHQTCYLRVTLATSSQLMDTSPHTRFFQDTERSFADIINEAYENSALGNLRATRGDEKINHPVLQYRETDWEFTLRMAGRLGTVVIPSATAPQIMLGLPEGQAIDETNRNTYIIGRKAAESRRKYASISNQGQQHFLAYTMESENRYKLGDQVKIDGKLLNVMAKSLVYKQGEAQVSYVLGLETEYAVPFRHHRIITGLELEGRVVERSGQQLRMVLNIDAARNDAAQTWFAYAPPTNNGMYNMPLENEKVMLQWQSEDDSDILAVRSVRQNSHDMPTPEQRHFLTEYQNHMMMVPNKMEYKNPTASIKWLGGSGFDIETSKKISLSAWQDIHINSSAQVRVFAPKRITVGKSGDDSSIDMVSSEIHIQALKDVDIISQGNHSKRPMLPEQAESVIIDDTVEKLIATVPAVLNAKTL